MGTPHRAPRFGRQSEAGAGDVRPLRPQAPLGPGGGYLDRVFRASEEENRRVILSRLPAQHGGSLLDIGTHDGSFTERIARRLDADAAHGIELIEHHAVRARERGIEVVTADIDAGLPFEDSSFDTVHANQVIEHVRRTDVFLSEVHRLLAPRGIACISTNNLSSWHNVLSLALGYQPMPMHVSDQVMVGNPLNPEHGGLHEDIGRTHLRLFTGRALRELCEHHGLRAVSLESSGYYPLPPRLARVAARLDSRHGAFLVGIFERA
ncbi:MAG: class I SAM-dependent methyltransferase [Thermoleophilaceae bacterium]